MSLLVLLTLSVQLVIGAEAALASGAPFRGEGISLRRLPTEVVRVIRDLVERRETECETTRVAVRRAGATPAPAAALEDVPGPVEPLGAWLLDLPPPALV